MLPVKPIFFTKIHWYMDSRLFSSNSNKMTWILAHAMAPSDSWFWLSNLNITSVGLFTLWVSRSDASGSVMNNIAPAPWPEDWRPPYQKQMSMAPWRSPQEEGICFPHALSWFTSDWREISRACDSCWHLDCSVQLPRETDQNHLAQTLQNDSSTHWHLWEIVVLLVFKMLRLGIICYATI